MNSGDHTDSILSVYRVVGFPAACTVNGLPGGSPAELFRNLSTYDPRERKVFDVLVTYSCPLDEGLIGMPFQLRLDVDHLGDDFPLPDDDDSVPANNVNIKSKFIK